MKRYLLFGGNRKDYTDVGGWVDYLAEDTTIKKITATAQLIANDNRGMSGELTWWHVVDTRVRKIIITHYT